MSINQQDLQKLLDEREASRASRKRAWENLQEIRWVLKDIVGMELSPPTRKTIDLEGRLVKDGVRTALRDRQDALSELVEAIRKYRKLAEKTPLTLQGSDFAQAVEELNKAIDRAEGLMLR
jgi:predicted RecB family endonuclease